ncbi:M23 family metallopeptidase [Williamsia sp. CHRR-6]|uniref:M23 family metallopeptidase n=1 Tax=Williamsia sp. CHRR-6 TaxID=2835871 RepID=UPI0035AD8087
MLSVRGNAVGSGPLLATHDHETDEYRSEVTSVITREWDAPNPERDLFERDQPARERTRRRGPRTAEVTQDILIAECEFDETAHHHPFAVSGAVLDDYRRDPDALLPSVAPRPVKTGGRHRIAAPPGALKGRAALIAMAAGAAVVAVTGQIDTTPATDQTVEPAKQEVNPAAAVAPTDPSINGDAGLADSPAPADMSAFTGGLQTGAKMAADAKAADRASRIPLFASPVALGEYQFTSCFCNRWGTFHGGIDFAAPLGTPIHAATDGIVKEAGPASGYGNWVQIEAADGTVTMYGHMASSGVLVSKGDRVTAGQTIAQVGNEGYSTGPHCHFEVWKNGTTKIDPMPWLAQRGVQVSAYTG